MNSKQVCRVCWLTTVPSGDQIDLLRAFARRDKIDLTVLYCSPLSVKGTIDPLEPLGRGRVLSGVRLPAVKGGFFFNPSVVPHLARANYDVLVVGGYIHPTLQMAMLVRAIRRQPWIFFGERPGMNERSFWSKKLRFFPLFMLRTANAVIGTGRLAQQQYQRRLGDGHRTFSLPYLVDLEPFLRLKPKGLTGTGALCFLACGELIQRKRTDAIIRAFIKAAKSCPSISLKIVGDGPELSNLKSQIPNELTSRVVFAGSVPFAERSKAFSASDVFIHAASHDGWGVVIQEAMSAGLPVIATRQTGAAYDLIEDGQNGFLFDAGDEDALSERMAWFAKHQEQLPTFAVRARDKVSSITPDWGAAELARIVESVLKEQGSQRK